MFYNTSTMLCKKKLKRVCCFGASAICLVTMVSLLCSINLTNRNGRDFMQMLNIDQLHATRNFLKIDDPRERTLQLTKNQTSANLIKEKESDQRISRASRTSEVQKQHKEPVTDTHSDMKPFKFFIYDLPKKFNTDLVKCVIRYSSYRDCFDLTNHGVGKLLYHVGGMAITDSNQFSLEVIVHHQLLKSPMRTLNATEADMFYIPAYMGLACFCDQRNNKVTKLVSELYKFLNRQQPFLDLKPHFSTLSKIEREQASKTCSLLLNKESRKVTYIAIERETNERTRNRRGLKRQKIVVAPYPSYVHYDSRHSDNFSTPSVSERNVFVFMAASARRTNPFRALLIDQFHNKTKDKYETFYKQGRNRQIKQVMLVTSECMSDHKYTTIPWMLHSTFCLQPPGDSPTRKSFYDSILSGCIPVLFHYPSKNNKVHYPFDWRFNYTDFTVILPAVDGVDSYPDIYNTLEDVPQEEIQRLYFNLDSVAQYFQYSLIHRDTVDFEDSAMFYIMEELKQIHHIS